ncbi:uncharacterized protein LODBEIA_P50860 [Lodderomyces beijingensis]|uniref:DNA recombination and repair protein Rad51-like C-terminal domain-containing protein n=1 Tax=Lodderomyces beijingensis TaxID=1775926 RepID=A0ABP0ZVW5_9ASCO
MVLLSDLVSSQQAFNRLTTSVPTLDEIILQTSVVKNKVYDFQSSPGCHGMHIVMSSLVVSHLLAGNKVVIIDALNRFPFKLLQKQPDFRMEMKRHVTHYFCDTFAKLYSLLAKLKVDNDTMVVINDFNSLVEFYKLEMSSTYEEMILRHHLDVNAVLVHNKQTGSSEPLPQLPANSDLLKISPIVKFESHLGHLFKVMNDICAQRNSMMFLLGYMETKYRPYKLKETGDERTPSTQSSFTEKGRTVLKPSEMHKSTTNKFIFYHDWYHKSPHFVQTYPVEESGRVTYVNQSMLRFVNAVQVETRAELFAPVYFDVDEEFYYDNDEDFDHGFRVRDLSAVSQNNHTNTSITTSGTTTSSSSATTTSTVGTRTERSSLRTISTRLSSSQTSVDATVINVTHNMSTPVEASNELSPTSDTESVIQESQEDISILQR